MIRGTKGFTLVELLVVMVILSLLAGAVTLSVRRHILYARQSRAVADIVTLTSALEAYFINVKSYPTQEQGLLGLITRPSELSGNSRWRGPYLGNRTSVPIDPWGQEYVYTAPGGAEDRFTLKSYGQDGKEGGEGLDKDITDKNLHEFE